jgi:hypothetical protein
LCPKDPEEIHHSQRHHHYQQVFTPFLATTRETAVLSGLRTVTINLMARCNVLTTVLTTIDPQTVPFPLVASLAALLVATSISI